MPIKLPTACLNYCTLAVGLTLTSSENPLLCRNLTNSSVIIKRVIYYNRILAGTLPKTRNICISDDNIVLNKTKILFLFSYKFVRSQQLSIIFNIYLNFI